MIMMSQATVGMLKEELIVAGKVESLEGPFRQPVPSEPSSIDSGAEVLIGQEEEEEQGQEEERGKAVEGPPRDKALKPQRNKRRRRRGG